jgi:hypothetical protein
MDRIRKEADPEAVRAKEEAKRKEIDWAKRNAKQFVRVNDDYFKIVYRDDGSYYQKSIAKQTIIDDYGMLILCYILKYDDWTMIPDNKNFQQTFGRFYNLYQPFPHKSKQGECKKILAFLKHIFEDQIELGLDYFTVLYLYPSKRLPVLILVSKDRETGKTTFINFVKLIFGANCVFIQSIDLAGSFNWHYAVANIICVDEAFLDKKAEFERLKMLATARNLPINAKYVKQTMIEFFGKIIICANDELDVVRIDQQETRYWVRKIPKPDHDDVNLLDEMREEIPAFLHYLESRPMETVKPESRLWLAMDSYQTEALQAIRENSRPWLYKELKERIGNFFALNDLTKELYADPTDLKDEYFEKNNQVQIGYIRKILKEDFGFSPVEKPDYYIPFYCKPRKKARYYTFKREDFAPDEEDDKIAESANLKPEQPDNESNEIEFSENINHDCTL